MSNFSNKSRRENQNTHFVFNNVVSEYRAVYEINVDKISGAKGRSALRVG
jgi:hypothetical protein